MNLSAVILTKNEEENISECLKNLNFCDEVVVIDDFSTDKTNWFAQKLGAKVYKRKLGNDFAAQRNFGLKKTFGKWILFLDADERVTPRLKNEIIQVINNPVLGYSGFYIKRQDILWSNKINRGEGGAIKLLRLGKRGSGIWQRKVHEVWIIKGSTKTLVNPIYHYPHKNIGYFLVSINRFSSLHALANFDEGKKSNIIKVTFWPFAHFIKNWVFKMGFYDKTPGFIIAILMSFHSFCAWSKLWLLQRKESIRV